MRFNGEMIAAVFGLLILGTLVGGILYMLSRFWGECSAETAIARERLSWPTTTVQATLFDTSMERTGKVSTTRVIGHYRYEFGGGEHTAEVGERLDGSLEELESGAEALKAEGKIIDLEVQYDPANSAVVSEKIVTHVPSCQYWIGGFFIFFCLMELLILRGLSRQLFG